MEILILFAIAVALVWGVVCIRLWQKTRLGYLPILGMLILVTGCVLGYDFFHLKLGPLPLTIDRALLLIMSGLFMVEFFRLREDIRPLNTGDLFVLATVLVLLINAVLHDWTYQNYLPVSRLIFFYCFPLILYFLMRNIRIGPAELKFMAATLGGLAVYLAVTAFAETRELKAWIFPQYITEPGEFYGRGRGPLLNPVINGMLMSLGCCSLWMAWARGSLRVRVLIAGCTALIALGVFCTFTRSVWLGFAAAAALFVFYPADQKTRIRLGLAGILALVVSFPMVGEKIFSFKRDKDVSQSAMELSAKLRPIFAEVAWRMFQDRPFVGCGYGQYPREKYSYLKPANSSRPLMMAKEYVQHNVFLAYLVETGLIGLVVFLLMLVWMGYEGLKLWNRQELELIPRLYGLLLIGVLLNYAINGMFHDVSIIPLANSILFFTFGIVNNLNFAAVISRQEALRYQSHSHPEWVPLSSSSADLSMSN